MEGGAPAGISIRPGEPGWRTNRIKMRMTTSRGKRMTMPKGTETVELPRNRSGRRKRAKREVMAVRLGDLGLSSTEGSCKDRVEKTALEVRRKMSMMAWAEAEGAPRARDGVDAGRPVRGGLNAAAANRRSRIRIQATEGRKKKKGRRVGKFEGRLGGQKQLPCDSQRPRYPFGTTWIRDGVGHTGIRGKGGLRDAVSWISEGLVDDLSQPAE